MATEGSRDRIACSGSARSLHEHITQVDNKAQGDNPRQNRKAQIPYSYLASFDHSSGDVIAFVDYAESSVVGYGSKLTNSHTSRRGFSFFRDGGTTRDFS